MQRLVFRSVLVVSIAEAGCLPTYTRSQIIVARRGSDSRDLVKAEAVCQRIAEQHGLAPRPFPQRLGRTTAYARPMGRDFSGPAPYVNASDPDPKALVTVTIVGEPVTDAGRKEIAAEALEKLRRAFGVGRVTFEENRYTEF